MSRTARRLPEYLDKRDVDILIENAPHSDAEKLMMLQWRAGLRVSEALRLRFSDITLGDHPTIRVRGGKGDKDRVVPLHPDLRQLLRWAPKSRRQSNACIIPFTRKTAWKWVSKAYSAAVTAGRMPPGKKVSPHILRHSFARHMLSQGLAINRLQLYLGHSYLSTTMIYSQLVPDSEDFIKGVE